MLNQVTTIQEILAQFPLGPKASELKRTRRARRQKTSPIRGWRKPSNGLRLHRRIHFDADVMLTNADCTIMGRSTTISKGGLFVATEALIFAPDDVIELMIIPPRGERTYCAKARIANQTVWPRGEEGYGLQFVEVSAA